MLGLNLEMAGPFLAGLTGAASRACNSSPEQNRVQRGDFGFRAHRISSMFIATIVHIRKTLIFKAFKFLHEGLAVIAISSNSVTTHPQDGPEFMAEEAKIFNYPFPYLYDESQDVARNFGAVCTPEFFLFKKDGRRPFELVYHGQFDDSRPSNNMPITGRDLSLAIDSVLSGQPVPSIQKPRSNPFVAAVRILFVVLRYDYSSDDH
ncbi:UNVERIFIED_CONTAM: hypothetical protein Scaly_2828000 [Sesamum calycinum]|uniref:Alkyl hydroperoxide reductase subunit C/ Thiol specific antioxidant domain-containing protein n=1 Tax=Sesamum calycinum TaxID=2727403 RepID=A0AAW2ITG4_9LAMI